MNCLRCGRKTAEGALFCSECGKVTAAPLEQSPYLSTRVILPAPGALQQGKQKQAQKQAPKSAAKPEKTVKKPRRLIAAVIVLSVVCALLLAACAYGVVLYLDGVRDRNRLSVQQEENLRLSTQLDAVQTEVTLAQSDSRALREQLDRKDLEIDRLEQTVNSYRMQGSETDQALRELQEDNLRLIGENSDYASQTLRLEQEQERLQTRIGTLEEENRTLQVKSEFIDKHVVFVENDGTGYYHSYDCSHFAKNSYWAYSKNLAVSRGYQPCPDCQQ